MILKLFLIIIIKLIFLNNKNYRFCSGTFKETKFIRKPLITEKQVSESNDYTLTVLEPYNLHIKKITKKSKI